MVSQRSTWSALALVVVGTVAVVTGCGGGGDEPGPEAEQAARKSVARYTTESCLAAFLVRPQALANHAYFASLPIDRYLPDSISWERLADLQVEELAVFAEPASGFGAENRHVGAVEWAAAVRLSQPIDLEQALGAWRSKPLPWGADHESAPEAVHIGKHACFRLPAGSFLEPPRVSGTLRFTDRRGQPAAKGINVGRIYTFRAYVEGGTESSAIFTLDQVTAADVVDGNLTLELRPDVFLTYALNRESTRAEMVLRNPDTGVQTDPIIFPAQSYRSHYVQVPSKLRGRDAKGPREIDLLTDVVSRGRVEVILMGLDRAIYIGVGAPDLTIRRQAYEYVHVAGNEMVIAQSPDLLKRMLASAPKPVRRAVRLVRPGAGASIVAGVSDETQRAALRQIAEAIGGGALGNHADGLTELTAVVGTRGGGKIDISAKFTTPRTARDIVQQGKRSVDDLRQLGDTLLIDLIHRMDTANNLVALVSDGIPMSVGSEEVAAARTKELRSLVGRSLDAIQVRSWGKHVTVRFAEPKGLLPLSKIGRIAVANADESLARDLAARDKFERSAEVYRRVTQHWHDEPQPWLRRAHHLAYNTSYEFEGYADRYAWIRRGVDALLDGHDKTRHSTDTLWMAARIIGWKIGTSRESSTFCQLFAEDKPLHQRLGKIVDLDKARRGDGPIDNWLVAELLFEHCIQRYGKQPSTSRVAPLILYSRPAIVKALYAQSLAEAGHWDAARETWKAAERLLAEFGDRSIPVAASERVRLSDLNAQPAKFPSGDKRLVRLKQLRKMLSYDYWHTRCRLEQTDLLQQVRKIAAKAAEQADKDPALALLLYRQSLQTASRLREQDPDAFDHLAGDLRFLARSYQQLAQPFGQPIDRSLKTLLETLEQSRREPDFPILGQPDIPESRE